MEEEDNEKEEKSYKNEEVTRSRAERAMKHAKAQFAPVSPARNEELCKGKARSLLLYPGFLSIPFLQPTTKIKKERRIRHLCYIQTGPVLPEESLLDAFIQVHDRSTEDPRNFLEVPEVIILTRNSGGKLKVWDFLGEAVGVLSPADFLSVYV